MSLNGDNTDTNFALFGEESPWHHWPLGHERHVSCYYSILDLARIFGTLLTCIFISIPIPYFLVL